MGKHTELKVGMKVSVPDFDGPRIKATTTSRRRQDQQGNWGYYVKDAGGQQLFVYTRYVRTLKGKQ